VTDYLAEHEIEKVISDAVLDAVIAKAADPLVHIADYLTDLSKKGSTAASTGSSLNKLQLKNVDVKGKRVLIRCDFNVPQDKKDPSIITNNARMCATSLPRGPLSRASAALTARDFAAGTSLCGCCLGADPVWLHYSLA